MCILDLSKVLMYEFYYDYVKNKYDKKSELLFTNTDSLKLNFNTEIKTKDVYEDFSSDKDIFDFSNYSTKSNYYENSKKLVIEKMKDETRGLTIEEFVGLKPKMCSFLVGNNKHKKSKYTQ